MKSIRKVFISSVLTAALIGGSSAGAASLKAEGLWTSEGKWMSDVSTYAGTGDFQNTNGAALLAGFRSPTSLAVLADGSILIADSRDHQIRKITAGQVTTYAGPETVVTVDELGFPTGGKLDGKVDEAFFNQPTGIAADEAGNIYVADAANHSIRKISTDSKVTTLAGTGIFGAVDGRGKVAQFNHPTDVAVAADGTVYVADTLNHLIRKIDVNGAVTTLNSASDRTIQIRPGEASFAGSYKDGSLEEAMFNEPSGLALDSAGNLYVSDTGNQRIRYIDFSAGTVTTVAGANLAEDGKSLYEANGLYTPGDYADGEASQALFDFPKGIAVTSEGGLLIADSLNHSIRYLYDGQVTTVTGNILTGEADGIEGEASFYSPTDIAVTADGSLLVADAYNNKIRKITPYQLPQDLPDNDSIKVVSGSSVITFEAQPELSNGRTMVPIRAISEALGYEVEYVDQEEARIVQLIKGDVTIELTIDQTGIRKLQTGMQTISKETDVAPYVNSDLTYVPVRFFAEEIGLDVQWDSVTQTAILRNKTSVQ
jgi:glucose/arabinose dehydrogenase